MAAAYLGIGILWLFLFGYVIVASIDFGAGFYSYYSSITGTRHLVHAVIDRYLSPVWEVTNVFLVFFMVGFVGFFPETAYYYGTALLVPGSIAVILLAIRGAYYAFNSYGSGRHPAYTLLYGLTGLLIPASLSTVLTISEGGYLQVAGGRVVLLYGKLFASPYSWSVVALAIVSVLYISSTFLTYYANKAKDPGALRVLRAYALFWGHPTLLASLAVFFAIHRQNPGGFAHTLQYGWMFAASFLCFVAGYWLIWRGARYGLAFVCVVLQFGLAFFGYGLGHLPYILYPYLTVTDHVTNPSMATALIAAFVAGLLLLLPSLWLLLRLFLFHAPYVEGRMKPKH